MMKNQTTKFVYCGKGQKITFSKCHDGSIRKSVIKETYAKVTATSWGSTSPRTGWCSSPWRTGCAPGSKMFVPIVSSSLPTLPTPLDMASIGLVRGTLTLWWKDLRLLKEECFIPSQGSQRQRGLSNCFYLRWGVLLEGDLPIVFSCSATPGGLPLKMRPSFQPRLWATTDEYHFTHEYLWKESESICIYFFKLQTKWCN